MPSTSQPRATFAMSVLTSPGCSARMVVGKGRSDGAGGVGEAEEDEWKGDCGWVWAYGFGCSGLRGLVRKVDEEEA